MMTRREFITLLCNGRMAARGARAQSGITVFGGFRREMAGS
jgi:hypothetical protein